MRVPCTCKRLVCRKCAGVAGQQPSGCGVCGAPGMEYTAADCSVDVGTLLALAAGIPDPEPYVRAALLLSPSLFHRMPSFLPCFHA